MTLKTVKLASCRYLDRLPTTGNDLGRAFRDSELEKELLDRSRKLGIGAQFGGTYFCHDVRVIRLPRHGASLPGRDRRLLLRRPPGARKDHARRCLSREARDEPRALPSRGRSQRPGSGGRSHRPQAADGGDPKDAFALSDQDPPFSHRPHHRGARHRAREAQGADRSRRRAAAVLQRPHDLLRGSFENPRGLRVRVVRTYDRRAHGLLRRPLHGARRKLRHSRERKPLAPGDGRLQEARRLLPRLDWRTGGDPRGRLIKKVEVVEYEELGMEAIFRIDV